MKFIKKNLNYLIVFAVLLVLMIVGTFYDLPISKAISCLDAGEYYSKNFFAVFFECFGEVPIYILPSLSFGVLFFYVKYGKLKKNVKITLMFCCAVFSVGLNFYGVHRIVNYLGIHLFRKKLDGILKIACEAGLGVAFSVLWFFLASLIKKEYLKSLCICSLIVILTAIFSQATTQLLKPFFGRARYRLMNVTEDFSEFTRWYRFNVGKKVSAEQLLMGIGKDGYKSFPSGHTTAAAMVIALSTLFSTVKIDKRRETLTFYASVIYVFAVAYSRIMMGAHYLTDVTAGATIGLISFVLSKLIVEKVVSSEKFKKLNL